MNEFEPSYGRISHASTSGDYTQLVAFARKHGFTITAAKGGKHNPGSPHYEGRAIDVRTRDKTAQQINAFIRAAIDAGYGVVDERKDAPSGVVHSGPHIHLEVGKRGK